MLAPYYYDLFAIVAFLIGVFLIYVAIKLVWMIISWFGRLIFCRNAV